MFEDCKEVKKDKDYGGLSVLRKQLWTIPKTLIWGI